MPRLDVLVLGTGPAATTVAMKCRERGRSVGAVDPRPFGGTCALRGCVPKKVLVRAAELYDWIRRAKGTGVRAEDPTIDWQELIAFKRSFTEPVTASTERQFRDAGLQAFHGEPRFLSPTRVAVDGQEIECRHIVVATGAVPRKLGISGENWIATSDDFLELERLPKRIVFIGGGYITFEFAHVAIRAGASVTIVEMRNRPLDRFDPDLVDCLAEQTRELGVRLETSTKAESVEKQGDGSLLLRVRSGDQSEAINANMIVHGAGRMPNTQGLDLEAGEVRSGPQGIEVDPYLRSVSNPAVFAAGDVATNAAPPLTPVASLDGAILAHNLLEDDLKKPDYRGVASAVFTIPALARVGLLEEEAREQGFRFTTQAGDRSDDTEMKQVAAKHGRYKVLVEETSGRILGAHLLGPDAAETINLFALALKHGITATELKSTLLAFPTFGYDTRGMV